MSAPIRLNPPAGYKPYGGANQDYEPSAERVVYVDDAGALRQGFLVETWSRARNQLDHTLVGGDGAVVSVERRTNNDRYNVFVEDPGKGAQAIVTGPGSGNARPRRAGSAPARRRPSTSTATTSAPTWTPTPTTPPTAAGPRSPAGTS